MERLILREPRELETGCWEWPGRRCKGDYAQISFQSKMQMVYRLVWEHLRGPIPPGRESHHRCRNRICCNPDHIVMLTQAEHRAIPFYPFVPSPTREKRAPRRRKTCGIEERVAREQRKESERAERQQNKEARRSLKAKKMMEAVQQKSRNMAARAEKKESDARQKQEKRQLKQEVLQAKTQQLQEQRAVAAQMKREARANAPCPRGHPRTSENTYITPQGYRQCRICREAQLIVQRAKPLDAPRKPYRKKTACVHGHPYTQENTYISPKGAKFCRECQRIKDEIRYPNRKRSR